jgi:pimeloyl-ACP methyl ester carboxylesterase
LYHRKGAPQWVRTTAASAPKQANARSCWSSLFPWDNPSPNIVATDVIRSTAYGFKPVYEQLIHTLVSNGYREYQVESIVARRTTAGCDTLNQNQYRPNLFLFAYDWRRDNAQSASATVNSLKDYIGCVRTFYPGKQVNLLAHSMGGLVARRYILDDTGGTVKGLITIAAPWLGAPKAIWVLQTGEDMAPKELINPLTLKYIAGSFAGAHQLLPSQAYYDLVGAFMSEVGWDFDGDSLSSETYSYTNFASAMDRNYGDPGTSPRQFLPGTTAKNFHAYSTARGKQDDWRVDSTGVKYYQIYGVQTDNGNAVKKTIGKIKATSPGVFTDPATDINLRTEGDGTVPFISAVRQGNGKNYNPSSITCRSSPNATSTETRCHMVRADIDDVKDLHVDIVLIDEALQYMMQYLNDANK